MFVLWFSLSRPGDCRPSLLSRLRAQSLANAIKIINSCITINNLLNEWRLFYRLERLSQKDWQTSQNKTRKSLLARTFRTSRGDQRFLLRFPFEDFTNSCRCRTEEDVMSLNFTKPGPRWCSTTRKSCRRWTWTRVSRCAPTGWRRRWLVGHSAGWGSSRRASCRTRSPCLRGPSRRDDPSVHLIGKLISVNLVIRRTKSLGYLERWKAFLDVRGRMASRAGGTADRRSQSQTYHLRSRESRARPVRPVTDSSESRASSSSHRRTGRGPCSWAASVGAPLIFCSGTRPVRQESV